MKAEVKFEQPLRLQKQPKPEGYSGEYMFVKMEGFEDIWKAKISVMTKGASTSCVVTVSKVDQSGKAFQLDGVPIVSEPRTHLFTNEDISSEDSDLEQTVMRVVETCIEEAHLKFGLKDRLDTLAARLTKGE